MIYGLVNTMTIRRIDDSVSQRIYPSFDNYGLIREINKNFTLTAFKLTAAVNLQTQKSSGYAIDEINILTARNDSLFERLSQSPFNLENRLKYQQLIKIRR